MRKQFVLAVAAVLALGGIGLVGCSSSSPGGGSADSMDRPVKASIADDGNSSCNACREYEAQPGNPGGSR